MSEIKLKPCPFCGSKNIDPKGWTSLEQYADTPEYKYGPACDDCGASAASVAEWNARIGDAPQAPEQRQFRHLKRGTTYRLASIEFAADDANEKAASSADRKIWCGALGKWARLQGKVCRGDRLVFYIADTDAELWARLHYEFFDGRFEEITPSRSAASSVEPVAYHVLFEPSVGGETVYLNRAVLDAWSAAHPDYPIKKITPLYAAPTTSPEPKPSHQAEGVTSPCERIPDGFKKYAIAASPEPVVANDATTQAEPNKLPHDEMDLIGKSPDWTRDFPPLPADEVAALKPFLKGMDDDTSPEPDAVRVAQKSDWVREITNMIADRETATRIVELAELNGLFDAAPAHGGWQDISTVPKDADNIDLWCRNVSLGSTDQTRFTGMFINSDGKWEDWHGYVLESKWRPTHWKRPDAGPISRNPRGSEAQ